MGIDNEEDTGVGGGERLKKKRCWRYYSSDSEFDNDAVKLSVEVGE